MKAIARVIVVAVALGLIASGGCGHGVSLYPVRGKVVYKDGSPVTGGMIELQSVDHQPPINARGRINPDGTFQLGTYTMEDGAVAGTHRAIVLPPLRDEKDTRPAPLPIATRYFNYDQSGLELHVEPNENDLTVIVERPR